MPPTNRTGQIEWLNFAYIFKCIRSDVPREKKTKKIKGQKKSNQQNKNWLVKTGEPNSSANRRKKKYPERVSRARVYLIVQPRFLFPHSLTPPPPSPAHSICLCPQPSPISITAFIVYIPTRTCTYIISGRLPLEARQVKCQLIPVALGTSFIHFKLNIVRRTKRTRFGARVFMCA